MRRIAILITGLLVASSAMLFIQGGKTRDPADLIASTFAEIALDDVAELSAPANQPVPAPPSTGARALAAAQASVAPVEEWDNPEMAAATARVLENLRRARGLAPDSTPRSATTQALTQPEADAYVSKLVKEALAGPPVEAPSAPSPKTTADQAAPPDPAPTARTYTVRKGDSLGSIARAFYGDGLQYLKIFEANRHILATPNHLEAGQKLTIPPAS